MFLHCVTQYRLSRRLRGCSLRIYICKIFYKDYSSFIEFSLIDSTCAIGSYFFFMRNLVYLHCVSWAKEIPSFVIRKEKENRTYLKQPKRFVIHNGSI